MSSAICQRSVGRAASSHSDEGFRVVFEIQPGSQHWKGWAVALLRAIEKRVGSASSVGFYDVVAGRMHPASRRELLDDSGSE